MTPLRAQDAVQLLHEIEACVPVADWSLGTTSVWPIARQQLFYAVTGTGHTPPRARGGAMGRVAKETATTAALRTRQRLRDRAHEVRWPRRADLLALSDGSVAEIGGTWWDRFLDPLLDAAVELGLTSLLLDPARAFPYPRHRPTRPVRPALDRLRLVALANRADPHLPGHEAFAAHVKERFGMLPPAVGYARLGAQARQVRAMTAWFVRRLQTLQPRVVLVVDYGGASMALNAAAREAGVVSVEVQHGLQGALHVAYAAWRQEPRGGFAELPQAYWVWSDDDAARVEGGRGCVVGGNPWLELWADGSHPDVRAARHEVETAVRPGSPHVLVTVPWGAREDELGPLLAAARARPGWRWWFRDHPMATKSEREAFFDVVARALGPSALADSRLATRAALPALLAHTAAHATVSSSTVLEAARFGITSVVLDPEGAALFPDEVARGLAVAASAGLLLDRLDAAVARGRTEGTREGGRLQPALGELISRYARARN